METDEGYSVVHRYEWGISNDPISRLECRAWCCTEVRDVRCRRCQFDYDQSYTFSLDNQMS
jgi:hypothetical protein